MSKRPNTIWLYRMVHWQNVAYILEHGMCCKAHENADPNYVNIGMKSLIEDRHEHPIPMENAGNLGEYVPFYFAGHSPMLYLIMNGYSGVTKRPQNDIVYIIVNYDKVKEMQLPFVFTDRNAKIAVANFYTAEKDLNKLNWQVIKSKDWSNDNDNLDRRDLKQAEFMVRNHLPLDCIYALVVKTEERKLFFEKIITKLGLPIKVVIDNKQRVYY
jgi:hypothetical protein